MDQCGIEAARRHQALHEENMHRLVIFIAAHAALRQQGGSRDVAAGECTEAVTPQLLLMKRCEALALDQQPGRE